MKLRELCEKCNVTRRAIQGYEKAGLIYPSSKNEMGHLLYEEDTVKQVRQIKLFQQFGFSIKEIQELRQVSNPIIKERVNEKLEILKTRRQDLEDLIQKAEELINSL